MCTWAASFGQYGSTWTVGYSDDIDLYIDVKHKNDWNSLDLKWEGNFNVNHGTRKRIVIVGVITTDFLKKIVSNPDGAYGQCFASAFSLDMSGATYDNPNDSEWTSLKSKLDGLWTGKYAYAHTENNVVTGKIYYPGDVVVKNTQHITLSSSFEPNDVCDIHRCGANCTHTFTDILKEAGITEKVRFDLVKVNLDYNKNNYIKNRVNYFKTGIQKINAFAIDLTGVTSLYDWAGIKNQYVSNIIFPHIVKDPLDEPTLNHRTGRIIYDRLPLTSDVKNNFNQDKLYNVIVVENCIECHEIHIDAYVNKPGFLATGLQYVSALEPSFYNNMSEPLWYNQSIENHEGRGYKYDTQGVTRLKLLGCVFARDLKGTSFENVDANGHLIPFGDYTYQNLIHFKAGMCNCELAPSKKNPNCKSGVHVNYLPEGTKGYSHQTFMSEKPNAGQVHTFDLTEAEFGYYDKNGVFQYYPADMTLSELQYFASWRSVAHIDLPTSATQFIIPEAFLQRSKYVRELCIPYNYTEIHRYAFLGEGLIEENGHLKGGISQFTTTAASDDEVLLLRQGDLINYGDKTVAFPSTTEFVGCGSFAGYDGAALFEDVYVLAPKAPICEMFAFDQKTYVGDNYHHKGHLIKKGNYVDVNMAMLHFPNTTDRIEMLNYSDMTRKYRLYDETGHYDNLGNILVWPTQQQYNRSFNQALAGVTWKAWNENTDGTDNPETAFSAGTVAGGGYQFANHEYMFPHSLEVENGKGISEEFQNEYIGFFDGSESKGAAFGDLSAWDKEMLAKSHAKNQTDRPLTYDWIKYGGWHQFVISELYDFLLDDPDPDKPKPDYFNFAKYNKNIWYAICFPFNLTKAQLLKAFGNPETGEYPVLSTLAGVTRDAEKLGITVHMSKDLVKNKILYDENYTVKADLAHGKWATYNEGVEYGDDDIVLEANMPYFILPCLPEEELVKAATGYRRCEITTVKDNRVMFPIATRVHAVNGKSTSFVDGQDTNVNSNTSYTFNYYFVGNYIPQTMPENAYYLKEYQKKNGDYWSSFYRNTPKKTDLMWDSNDAIVIAKVDDTNGSHSKGALIQKQLVYNGNDHNYVWNVNAYDDWVFFAETGHEAHSKSAFGMQIEDNYTTSIELPSDMEDANAGKVYNLNGQFVGIDTNKMAKGIYIVGGKKIVK